MFNERYKKSFILIVYSILIMDTRKVIIYVHIKHEFKIGEHRL